MTQARAARNIDHPKVVIIGGGFAGATLAAQLLRQSGGAAEHTFAIEFLDPGVQAYSFTFG